MAAQLDPVSQDLKNTEAKKTEAREDVKDSYETMRSDIAELANSVKKLAGTEFGGMVEGAQEQAELRLSQVEKSIREKPAQAAMIAAGVGFLVGLLIVR